MGTEQTRSPQLTTARLIARGEALTDRQTAAVAQVGRLVRTQQEVSRELSDGMGTLQRRGADVAPSESAGLLASLRRTFARRQSLLQRRSVAEELLSHYEVANVALRRASAFADELRLCAVEMQAFVDELYDEHAVAQANAREAAARILEIEAEIDEMDEGDEMGLDARRIDALRFEERTRSTAVQLQRARAALCRQELAPARSLRDTVLSLHEDMAACVVQATASVGSAGRRIQALGMAADAPMVVSELRDSLQQLDTAMHATTVYIAQAQDLLTRVLPEISADLEARTTERSWLTDTSLEAVEGDRARLLADQALRDAAAAEVEAVGHEAG